MLEWRRQEEAREAAEAAEEQRVAGLEEFEAELEGQIPFEGIYQRKLEEGHIDKMVEGLEEAGRDLTVPRGGEVPDLVGELVAAAHRVDARLEAEAGAVHEAETAETENVVGTGEEIAPQIPTALLSQAEVEVEVPNLRAATGEVLIVSKTKSAHDAMSDVARRREVYQKIVECLAYGK